MFVLVAAQFVKGHTITFESGGGGMQSNINLWVMAYILHTKILYS